MPNTTGGRINSTYAQPVKTSVTDTTGLVTTLQHTTQSIAVDGTPLYSSVPKHYDNNASLTLQPVSGSDATDVTSLTGIEADALLAGVMRDEEWGSVMAIGDFGVVMNE